MENREKIVTKRLRRDTAGPGKTEEKKIDKINDPDPML